MPKVVFRVKLSLVRESTDTPFFASLPAIENAKVEWKLAGKILNHYGEISEDGLTRVYVIDFPAKALKDEFAGTTASREGIRGLLNYNSLNKITTYFDEKDVTTNDYD